MAIDAGSIESGIVILINGQITHAAITLNEELIAKVREYLGVEYKLKVLVEDLAPYSMQLTPDVLKTAKVLGMIEYKLKVARISYTLVTRSKIKEWVYSEYKSLLEPLVKEKVVKRMKKKNLPTINKDGSEKKGSFAWLDDRLIEIAMRKEWDVPAQRGKKNRFALKAHSFQALALATLFIKEPLCLFKMDKKRTQKPIKAPKIKIDKNSPKTNNSPT